MSHTACPNCDGSGEIIVNGYGREASCEDCSGSGHVPEEWCPCCHQPAAVDLRYPGTFRAGCATPGCPMPAVFRQSAVDAAAAWDAAVVARDALPADSRPRVAYVLPDGTEVAIIMDHGEDPPATITFQLKGGKVVPATRKEAA